MDKIKIKLENFNFYKLYYYHCLVLNPLRLIYLTFLPFLIEINLQNEHDFHKKFSTYNFFSTNHHFTIFNTLGSIFILRKL
jgi:hypothetical protein